MRDTSLGRTDVARLFPSARPGVLEEQLRGITLVGIPRFEAVAIEKLCAAR